MEKTRDIILIKKDLVEEEITKIIESNSKVKKFLKDKENFKNCFRKK